VRPGARGPRVCLMSARYRSLFRHPGAIRLVGFGLPARLPVATYGIGLLALLRDSTGSWGVSGVVAAAYTLTVVVSQVTLGRCAQRWWFRAILAISSVLHGATMFGLLVAVDDGAGALPIAALAGALGLLQPPAGVVVRSRWADLLTDHRELDLAMFLESALDEAVFVVGPAAVSGLGVVAGPAAALALACTVTCAGNLGLCTLDMGGYVEVRRQPGPRTALLRLALAFMALGMAFAAVQIGVFAATAAGGAAASAGIVLSSFSVVSLVAGVLLGRRLISAPMRAALLVLGAALLLPIGAPAHAVGILVVLLLPAATAASPSMALGFRQAAEAASPQLRARAFAWCSAALGVGLATGNVTAGLVAEGFGWRAVFLLGALVALAPGAAVAPRHLEVHSASATDSSHGPGHTTAGARERDSGVGARLVRRRELRIRGGGVDRGRGGDRQDPAAATPALPRR